MAQSTVRLIVDAQSAIRPLQQTDRITKTLANNTDKLNKARDIYKDSNGLDNISEHMMRQFKQIMLS